MRVRSCDKSVLDINIALKLTEFTNKLGMNWVKLNRWCSGMKGFCSSTQKWILVPYPNSGWGATKRTADILSHSVSHIGHTEK